MDSTTPVSNASLWAGRIINQRIVILSGIGGARSAAPMQSKDPGGAGSGTNAARDSLDGLAKRTKKTPCSVVKVHARSGSFDSVAASLRDAAIELR
jgi:hypothetical protein